MDDEEEKVKRELDELADRFDELMDSMFPGERAKEYDLGQYILDEQHNPVHTPGGLKWAIWFEQHRADRIVKQEEIGPYFVSTVFLGLDHSPGRMFNPEARGAPILFETMVFFIVQGSRQRVPDVCERCSTWSGAEKQHARVAAKFRTIANG